ncbi:cytochrome P450 [Nocardia pseudobrasiliensis]|uniref:Cytochrome P450 n=1 Tax=Nocardia pseudobrasiliensis TaxID=45979 RepID=A0A370HPA7_9NOCA|nr:cytochrome P450 [Nocardia pseudobrasiliensis]RDI60348.1 cytochrome P450 [Nocardia pseudobrasiliensis]
MSRWWAAALAVPVAASLPHWLPASVVALRVRIFDLVNGETGLPTPSDRLPIGDFKRLYGHPAANGRSAGAALSDLFWYWLAPGPQVHQEHLEPGPRYDAVAKTTRRILARLDRTAWTELVTRATSRIADELGTHAQHRVRLRDLMMPIWAEVYYELVFAQPCPRTARDLITGNADDVVHSLKCTRPRHMKRRARLTAYLRERIATDPPAEPLPAALTAQEQAYYLQGTFFNTAVVQMSEAMAHLLLAIATNPAVQDRLVADPLDDTYLDHVIDETLWHYPLFGIAHRITTDEIPATANCPAVPTGSVLLFDYPRYQQGDRDHRFDPDRWSQPESRPPQYIPFGIAANRPCPARGFATLTMRVCAREMLRRYHLDSAVEHTRSLPSRGPCVLTPRAAARPTRIRLAATRWRDRWETVPRSLIQLVLGSWMVYDARRKRLCENYFADRQPIASRGAHDTTNPPDRPTP